jgi:hypothetical protein
MIEGPDPGVAGATGGVGAAVGYAEGAGVAGTTLGLAGGVGVPVAAAATVAGVAGAAVGYATGTGMDGTAVGYATGVATAGNGDESGDDRRDAKFPAIFRPKNAAMVTRAATILTRAARRSTDIPTKTLQPVEAFHTCSSDRARSSRVLAVTFVG